MTQDVIPIGQVLHELGIDRVTAYRWEKKRKLVPLKDARGYRFYERSEVERIRQEREPK